MVGVEGSTFSTPILPESTERSSLTGQVRQFISSHLHQQTGNKERNPVVLGTGNLKLGRKTLGHPVNSTLKRGTEPSGRLPQQKEKKRRRLGIKSGSVQIDHAIMGNTSGGLFYLKRKEEGLFILLPEEVRWSARGKRATTEVDIQQMICPPPSVFTSSAKKIPYREHFTDPHCTTLAQETIVLYSKSTCCRTPLVISNPEGLPLSGPSMLSKVERWILAAWLLKSSC